MYGDVNARLDELLEADPTADGPELATRLLDTVDNYEELRALTAPLVQDLAADRIERRATRLANAESRRREDALAQATLGCLDPEDRASADAVPILIAVGRPRPPEARGVSEIPREP